MNKHRNEPSLSGRPASVEDAFWARKIWELEAEGPGTRGIRQQLGGLRIPRGCPLSPLLGALCLTGVQEEARRRRLFVARFMDDWVVLAKTRWRLRGAVRAIRRLVAGRGLETST